MCKCLLSHHWTKTATDRTRYIPVAQIFSSHKSYVPHMNLLQHYKHAPCWNCLCCMKLENLQLAFACSCLEITVSLSPADWLQEDWTLAVHSTWDRCTEPGSLNHDCAWIALSHRKMLCIANLGQHLCRTARGRLPRLVTTHCWHRN